MAGFFREKGREGRIAFAHSPKMAVRFRQLTVALFAALALCAAARGASAGTLVSMNTNRGTILIDLFDDLVPETVDNFLAYVNANAFANTLVHRSTSLGDTGLAVIQGGGYTYNSGNGQFVPIAKNDPVVLQYNRANTKGTISMARSSALNSGTSEWFINTIDNTTALGQANNGGYAVFGWIVGDGMPVAEGINNLFKKTVSGFSNVPLQNYNNPDPVQQSNLIFNNSITLVKEHASYQNPFLDVDVVNDGQLKVSDAHAVINDLLANGPRALTGPFSGTNYLDTNGSGTVTVADAHRVINAILSQGSAAAPLVAGPGSDEPLLALMAQPAILVPEPSSLALGAVAALALAGAALRRRRRQQAFQAAG